MFFIAYLTTLSVASDGRNEQRKKNNLQLCGPGLMEIKSLVRIFRFSAEIRTGAFRIQVQEVTSRQTCSVQARLAVFLLKMLLPYPCTRHTDVSE
jgi:hypothetical protein